ncbi:MAG: hypothetical protein IJJ69_14785 [Oscillospiraceae bacterium]|nr:hypothetical protein [Oscillospiraceae bacterium]
MPNEIVIDGTQASAREVFRGLGCVTGNGSSRLLIDYKRNHPEVYQEIMKLLFQPDYGASLVHIKIEMGADVNSSSGTEPCVKRYPEEKTDVTRGAGFQFASDAKKLNPEITLDLLRWGEPHWVTSAFKESRKAGFDARYRWYYETLKSAYETYRLKFDFISPDANETEKPETDWLIYFSERLKSERRSPYDFSKIKIVASDEVGTRNIAAMMRENEQLRNAVDVIGLHYTSQGDENTKYLHEFYEKEIWYSEGIAPCNVPELSRRVDGTGITGSNGAINTAVRIINAYANGRMNLYEFQPPVSGYYDGSCYSPKQLITARTPWSGHYTVDVGLWISAHFMRFSASDWQYVPSACFGDGEENQTIWNTTNNYMTLLSPDKTHFTMHFANDTAEPRSYQVKVINMAELPEKVSFLQTAGSPAPEPVDKNWFRIIKESATHISENEAVFQVTVKPYSLLTVTTLKTSDIIGTEQLRPIPENRRLSLPFVLPMHAEEERNGYMPLYTTDQGGAFELVRAENDVIYLEQKITKDILPTNWRFRGTPEPITCFGDDTWTNYQASAIAYFASMDEENYVGVGLHYNSAVTNPESSACGFQLRLYANGIWQLRYMDELLHEGKAQDYIYEIGHKISIACMGILVFCFIDGHSVYEMKLDTRPLVHSGRMSLCSAYYQNRFRDIKAEKLNFPIAPYVYRQDCLSSYVKYLRNEESEWNLLGMTGYQFYNRTCAVGKENSELKIRFYGNSISLLGRVKSAGMTFWIDKKLYTEEYAVSSSNYRETFFTLEHLHTGWHTLRMLITKGSVEFDAFEILTDDENADYTLEKLPEDILKKSGKNKKESKKEVLKESKKSELMKTAVPVAGAAAGVATVFAVGKILKSRKKKKSDE